mgnify:FL=1
MSDSKASARVALAPSAAGKTFWSFSSLGVDGDTVISALDLWPKKSRWWVDMTKEEHAQFEITLAKALLDSGHERLLFNGLPSSFIAAGWAPTQITAVAPDFELLGANGLRRVLASGKDPAVYRMGLSQPFDLSELWYGRQRHVADANQAGVMVVESFEELIKLWDVEVERRMRILVLNAAGSLTLHRGSYSSDPALYSESYSGIPPRAYWEENYPDLNLEVQQATLTEGDTTSFALGVPDGLRPTRTRWLTFHLRSGLVYQEFLPVEEPDWSGSPGPYPSESELPKDRWSRLFKGETSE